MRYRAGFRIHPLGKCESVAATATEATHGLWDALLWLLGSSSDEARPVRVFYKFKSGGWRYRSTRQLEKVYRCR